LVTNEISAITHHLDVCHAINGAYIEIYWAHKEIVKYSIWKDTNFSSTLYGLFYCHLRTDNLHIRLSLPTIWKQVHQNLFSVLYLTDIIQWKSRSRIVFLPSLVSNFWGNIWAWGVMKFICKCISCNNCRNIWSVFMKYGRNVMPSKTTQHIYLLIPCHNKSQNVGPYKC
jgi:hypothetical protein